jgi:SOS-response transcriptional repressor LexA
VNKQEIKKLTGLGRVRMSDDSMKGAGLRRGDVAHVDLGSTPKQGELCLAFTATGKLVVRRYRTLPNRYIVLTREPAVGKVKVYHPRAVVIFGRVSRIEKGGA